MKREDSAVETKSTSTNVQNELAQEKREKNEFSKQLAAAQSGHTFEAARLQSQISALQSEKTAAENKLSDAQKEAASLRSQMFQLERDLMDFDEVVIKDWRAHTSEINTLTQKHHDEVTTLRTQLSESNEIRYKLEVQVLRLQAKGAGASNSHEELGTNPPPPLVLGKGVHTRLEVSQGSDTEEEETQGSDTEEDDEKEEESIQEVDDAELLARLADLKTDLGENAKSAEAQGTLLTTIVYDLGLRYVQLREEVRSLRASSGMNADGQWASPPQYMHYGPEHVAMFSRPIIYPPPVPPPQAPVYHSPPYNHGNTWYNGYGAQGSGYYYQPSAPGPNAWVQAIHSQHVQGPAMQPSEVPYVSDAPGCPPPNPHGHYRPPAF